jgi:diguanylate cyclase (GGDEF)-like protein/PAS domain S-box-containing protein/putative nucleotidyltransferase with HDIG domain
MRWLSPPFKLAVGITSTVFSVLFVLTALEFVADPRTVITSRRMAVCEQLAIHCSLQVNQQDSAALPEIVRAVCLREKGILSGAVRQADGTLIVEVGDHVENWSQSESLQSTADQVQVPIVNDDELWGTVEVRCQPLSRNGTMAYYFHLVPPYITLTGGAVFLLTFVYLSRSMSRRDNSPSSEIPERVRATLDTLVEGVLVMDTNQKIALANKSFAESVGQSIHDLEGRSAKKLQWLSPNDEALNHDLPWGAALKNHDPKTGVRLGVASGDGQQIKFSVNSTPITDDDGVCRGALATFDDISQSEKKNEELERALKRLGESRTEIRRQNKQLKILASVDPLTDCLNRRSFFEQGDVHWNISCRKSQPLCCIMLDIDHFKAVNDEHGHQTGDEVLQEIVRILKSTLRGTDILGRLGGEEFCVLLPLMDIDGAMIAADRFRCSVESGRAANLDVTISLGVSAVRFGAHSTTELVEQADQALYFSKNAGRNRVTRWDEIDEPPPVDERPATRDDQAAAERPQTDAPIPAAVVKSLITALAHRDSATAAHSRRVANYCAAMAENLMPESESSVLEAAALLHDIGKLGVPDAVLLKPGPLTETEWEIMRAHDEMGVDIVASACHSQRLVDIIRNHHAWFGGNPRNTNLPTGRSIPRGARILAIADAYDAMVSDRVYRKGRSQVEAFAELGRCARTQFDPELVERFITTLLDRDEKRPVDVLGCPKQTAVQIGIQLEQLVSAFNNRDVPAITALAGEIKSSATNFGVAKIAAAAGDIEESIVAGQDWLQLAELTNSLLEVCCSTESTGLGRCLFNGRIETHCVETADC